MLTRHLYPAALLFVIAASSCANGGSGLHSVRVEKDGFRRPAAVPVRIYTSGTRVTWSLLLPVPVLLVNVPRGLSWKSSRPDAIHFVLQPEGLGT